MREKTKPDLWAEALHPEECTYRSAESASQRHAPPKGTLHLKARFSRFRREVLERETTVETHASKNEGWGIPQA